MSAVIRPYAAAARWAQRRPPVVDALLTLSVYVLLTFGITSASEARHAHGTAVGAVLNLALVGPLLAHRLAPRLVLAVTVSAALVVSLAFGPTGGEAAVLMALATLTAREGASRASCIAAAVVVVGLVGAVLGLTNHPTLPLVAGAASVIAAVALGAAVNALNGQRLLRAERDARLRRERAREADLLVSGERTRIAREVHDIVAHHVTVMVALAEGAGHTVATDPARARAAIDQTAVVGREALVELRELVTVLRDGALASPELEPQPGLADVDDLLAAISAAGLPAGLISTGDPGPLTPATELALYRVTQEALTNSLRHGHGATRVDVRVTWSPDSVRLAIIDDGTAPSSSRLTNGRGLTGMRERAIASGATLSAGPRSGATAGWQVTTTFPLSTCESG